MRKIRNIYVASSWRNEYQPEVVQKLRHDGFNVYDFKDSEGFGWHEVDPHWQTWSPQEYLRGLEHSAARRGFERDMAALRAADACVMVMPCGMSAALELGWAKGAGLWTAVYVPALREPDLMVKMADLVSLEFEEIRAYIRRYAHKAIMPRS